MTHESPRAVSRDAKNLAETRSIAPGAPQELSLPPPAGSRRAEADRFPPVFAIYLVERLHLWPVTGNSKRDLLSAIRNKLVHGEVYDHRHYEALIGAGQHLRWSVYWMIFAMLGWPAGRTKIRPEIVARDFIHKTLERDHQILSS